MKTTPTFGMLFRFSNEISREDAAFMLRMRRKESRYRGNIICAEPGSYYFSGFILRTR